jgi:hypothetical protein
MFALFAVLLALAGCVSVAPEDFSACPAFAPAIAVTEKFLSAFNAKDMTALEKTFHFPHMRIGSYPINVLTGPGQQDDVFGNLAPEGWDHSAWKSLKVIQCSPTKAHITGTFVRYRKDGTAYAQFDGLYIVELRDGYWGITARSSFAP